MYDPRMGASIAVLAAVAGSLLLPQSPADEAAEYEVFYHHAVRNKTAAALTDVRIYLPVPQSDGHQEVRDFRVETLGNAVRVSNRTDAYGTAIKRIAIARLEPGQEIEVGFSCVVRLSKPAPVRLDRRAPADLKDIPQEI